MKTGDLVRVKLPTAYHGIPHVYALHGSLGVIVSIESRGDHQRVYTLVLDAVRTFDAKYVEVISETR